MNFKRPCKTSYEKIPNLFRKTFLTDEWTFRIKFISAENMQIRNLRIKCHSHLFMGHLVIPFLFLVCDDYCICLCVCMCVFVFAISIVSVFLCVFVWFCVCVCVCVCVCMNEKWDLFFSRETILMDFFLDLFSLELTQFVRLSFHYTENGIRLW